MAERDFEKEFLDILAFNAENNALVEDVLDPVYEDLVPVASRDTNVMLARNFLMNGGTALAEESQRKAYIAQLQRHLLQKYALPFRHSAQLFEEEVAEG